MLKLHLHLPFTSQTYVVPANIKIDEDEQGEKIVHLTFSPEDAEGLIKMLERHLVAGIGHRMSIRSTDIRNF